MATRLTANVLHMEVEEDVMTFGVADDRLDPKEYLLLSRSLDADEQDAAMGIDGVYVEYGDQDASTYGGVEEVILGERRITFRVSPETAWELGTEDTIEVQLNAENCDIHQVERFLVRLFEQERGVVIKRETQMQKRSKQ